MGTHFLSSVAHLSNSELLASVQRLAQREREATAVLIAHLAELDARRLYLAEGCSSLFTYCTQVLHLAEHAAYNRIETARAVRKFPVLLERLADGSVTLTTIRRLAPHLTPENHKDLVARARHRSRQGIEELVAHLHPKAPVPTTIRRLPPRHCPVSLTPCENAQDNLVVAVGNPMAAPASLPAAKPPAGMTPLGLQRYRIQFTASAETHAKIRQAQALLRHQVQDGDVATIIDRALTALLEQVAKQKVAATALPREKITATKPRPWDEAKPTARSRHIPNAVKRGIWIRDGGRCAFISKGGRRCSEDGFLEFHHVRPYAAGGKATAENVELRCRAHNVHEAELYFGPESLAMVREIRASYLSRLTRSETSPMREGVTRPSASLPWHRRATTYG